jgi:hypothetical protein
MSNEKEYFKKLEETDNSNFVAISSEEAINRAAPPIKIGTAKNDPVIPATVFQQDNAKTFIPGRIEFAPTPTDPTQVTTPIGIPDVTAVYSPAPKYDTQHFFNVGIQHAQKLQELLKNLGKEEVELSTKKAQQKLVYYRRLGVAAADKANTNDKAREAACYTQLESDAWYCQLASEIASCEVLIESLKADVVYYKALVLFNLAMTGMKDGNLFWS